MSESTHKHRNVIDDILDLGLSAACVVYYVFHDQMGITLTDEQMVMIGAAGAAGRASARRIMMKLWGAKLGVEGASVDEEAAKETVSAPVESEGDDADGPEEASSDDSGEGDGDGGGDPPASSSETQKAPKIEAPPPPKVGG